MRRAAAALVPPAASLARRRLFSAIPGRAAKYGFIGLGQMGFPMVKQLQAKLQPTDEIAVFDINADAMKTLASETAAAAANGSALRLAASAADAANEAMTVVTVLPEPRHVQNVYQSILASTSPPCKDRLLVDCSTIDPSTSRRLARAMAEAGHGSMVDAPMSGGVVGAQAGSLTFMVGAEAELMPRLEPLLLCMGRRVLRCGSQGAGLSAKLANNYLLAVSNIATAEAMNLGIRWGLDPSTLARVINLSTGRCWPSEANNPVKGVVDSAPAARDYRGGFGIALMKKDMRLAIMAARQVGARMQLADAAFATYDEADKLESCQGRDFSVVYRYLAGHEAALDAEQEAPYVSPSRAPIGREDSQELAKTYAAK